MSPPRLLYTLLLTLIAPLLPLRLLWRARKQPAYLKHVSERFGFYGAPPAARPIWIHAVSVGETRAAQPLIAALRQRYPGHPILLTHMTPTGRETGEQLYGDQVLRCYLPYDFPFAVGRFLAHFQPRTALLMETEVWPNLLAACAQRRLPVALVNARLSEKSARRYQKIAALARETFARFDQICAQTNADAARLRTLGARAVQVVGNLKFDITPPADAVTAAAQLRSAFGERPILLAASTREGEETLLLDAFTTLTAPRPLLVLVPRHPQRFDEVAALITHHGLHYQRRSANEAIRADTDVVLGDSMGEMFVYYGAVDIAIIGGSLLPYGGQNLIESCAMGTPVLLGPHTYNFAEAAQQAIANGAARRGVDAGDLMQKAQTLLADTAARQTMAHAARGFWQANQGATERTLATLAPLLDPSGKIDA